MFTPDGYSTIIKTAIISIFVIVFTHIYISSAIISNSIAGLMAVLFLFMLYFFRDPERNIPDGENLLISPADGKVIVLKPVDYHWYLDGSGTQISIFLSPLDVHVNRVPASGIIESTKYFEGKYLVAWHKKASELNERSEFGLKHASGTKIFFNQITGYLARRITIHITEGDQVKAGEKFGMMKFGSRMDIIVPSNVILDVKKDQKVVGGETIIGQIT